jgi:hypothetical protein
MRLWSEILQMEDTLFRKIFNHYRPELHYMRGPGPKWLEKHSAVAECAMPQVSVADHGALQSVFTTEIKTPISIGMATKKSGSR